MTSSAEGPAERPGTDAAPARVLEIPEVALVALVGASGSGKSTFAREHFGRYEVISSDVCRGMVSDDENDQNATQDAFEVLSFIAGRRLAAGRLTVVDATNVQRDARRKVVELAKAHDVLPVAIVLDLSEAVCLERNRQRPERDFGPHVVRRQVDQLRRSLKGLAKEGFRKVHVLRSVPRWSRRRSSGPGCSATSAASRGRSTWSVTCTVAGRSWSPCWLGWATRSSGTPRAGRSTPATPRAVGSSSSVTSSTVVPTVLGCSGWPWG